MDISGRILFEDNHLIVINKLPGELTQGDKTGDGTLQDDVKEYLKVKYEKKGNVYLGSPHRLDRPTSGAILYTKTEKALIRMSAAFRTSDVKKTYWAIVDNLPEKEVVEIEMPNGSKWAYPVSQGVVSLQTTRDTGYQVYIMVQNELTRAFNEVRDEVSMVRFGRKFGELQEEESKVITKAVPLKISEAEPRNMGKK